MRFLFFLFLFSIQGNLWAQSDTLFRQYKADSGYFASFDKRKIYYEVRGSGEPVVLLHGFIVTGESWKRTALLNDLLQAGYKVITLDLRGNGKSDRPHEEEAYANDAEAKDVIGLTKFLNLKEYDAIGYSRGSIITARLLHLDKKVRKAVLGGMGPDFTNPQWPRRIMFYNALSGKQVPELAAMVKNVKAAGLDTMVLAFLQKYQPSTSPAQLAAVKQPVLVISGDKDEDNGSAPALAKMFPHATLATVPGDHGGAYRTEEFAQAVIHFLQQK